MSTPHSGRSDRASLHERALLFAAQREDRAAQEELLRRYEPLVGAIAGRLRVPAGYDRRDLAQEARLGLLAAIRAWAPQRGAFPAFARLCIRNQALKALDAAGASKHQLLSQAFALDCSTPPRHDRRQRRIAAVSLDELVVLGGRGDPVATLLARERLDAIRARLASLTAAERIVLAGVLNDKTHGELAAEHGWTRKAVTLAVRRARHKLAISETAVSRKSEPVARFAG